MANPDFRSEASADQAGTTATVLFMPTAWQANDILVIFVATDGYVPTLSSPQGFVLAQDPQGNTASVTTNGGTPGTNDCGFFVFWKRAIGNSTAQDPAPTIAATSNGGTCWCVEMNSYSGARTSGTPWHIISTSTTSTSSSNVNPPAVTPTLNACLVMPGGAAATDDQAFNNWTVTGAASPTGQIDAGWHTATGNQCSFTTGRGGFATTGGSRSGSTTLGAATPKQALITLVMASLNEVSAPGDDEPRFNPQPPTPIINRGWASGWFDDELPITPTVAVDEDDGTAVPPPPVVLLPVQPALPSFDELPPQPTPLDDDGCAVPFIPASTAMVQAPLQVSDEIPGPVASQVDEDPFAWPSVPIVALTPQLYPSADDLPITPTSAVEDEAPTPIRPQTAIVAIALQFADDDLPVAVAPDDDDGWFAVSLTVTPDPVLPAVIDDELPITPTSAVDEGPWLPPGVPPAIPMLAAYVPGQDEVPTPPTGTVDDEGRWIVVRPYAPPPIGAYVDSSEVWATTPAAGIGGASDAQRSFLAPPQTGTLSTVAPLPSWTTSHAYVIDPTQGGINRVQNGGNHYQCSQDGTSASSGGGPSGTGTNITDGTAHWRYIGPVQSTDTAAGSQILCTVMRGNQSQAASVNPTDNDGGGTYTVISNNEYTNFTGSFAGVWRRPTASNAKTNFQASGVWGGSGGAGDEMSIGWVEVQGVQVGAPHAFSHVERLSSSGGTVTAAAITTTVQCVIVSYWFGNGTVQTAGQPDAATPAGGLTLIAGSTGELSLTTNGYVQHMVAWRIANPGTFSEVWTASPTDQGAQLVTVALAILAPTTSVDEDLLPPMVRAAQTTIVRPVLQTSEDFAPQPVLDEDAGIAPLPWVQLRAIPPQVDDEQPGAVLDEDPTVPVLTWPQVTLRTSSVDDDLPPPAMVDEDAFAPVVIWPQLAPILLVPQTDDASLPAIVEEDAFAPVVVWAWAWLNLPVPKSDDVTTQPSAIIDEDPFVRIVLWPVTMQPSVAPQIDEVGTAPTTAVDEDAGVSVLAWQTAAPQQGAATGDELTTSAAIDDDAGQVPSAWAQRQPIQVVSADDEIPEAALEETGWTFGVRWDVPQPRAALADDEIPTAPAQMVPDEGWSAVTAWPPPPPVQQSQLPDPEDLPIPDPFAAVVDEDPFLPPVTWAPIWTTSVTPPNDLFSGDLGRHVHIRGTSPDPEVYDGPLSVGLFYGSS